MGGCGLSMRKHSAQMLLFCGLDLRRTISVRAGVKRERHLDDIQQTNLFKELLGIHNFTGPIKQFLCTRVSLK